MKTTREIAGLTIIFASAFVATHAFAADETQAALLAEAKVTEAQARTTALSKAPNGTLKSAELEREHGRLVWSFDIARPSVKGVTEIQVDAKSGKIVSVKKETPAQEAKEVKADEPISK